MIDVKTGEFKLLNKNMYLKKKIAILSSVNIKHMSMISIYTNILRQKDIEYDIIYMDKYGEDEEFECSKKYRYTNPINRKWPSIIKAIKYMMFVPYAKKILKRNKYDFIIVWNDLAIFMFANYLSRNFKKKYCLNVRDNMFYEKRIFKKMYDKCFINSAFNTISSNGYLDILPKNTEYIQIHSLNIAILKGMKIHTRMRYIDEPIRIGFIGYVRYFERNKKMLSIFANDTRFEMHYYGTNARILEEYAKRELITNCIFHDSFPVKDTSKYLENIDIINNLYGNETINVQKAISIKFYHALFSKIPILVNENTYIGELASSLGIGFYVTNLDKEMKDKLYEWYHSIDYETISGICDNQLRKILTENTKLELLVQEFICR